jgi:hypothetical protein
LTRFIAVFDYHYGHEWKDGALMPLHDADAMALVLQFAEDFKPDVFYLGGDVLDCSAVNHHNAEFPGRLEGLRLGRDMQELKETLIIPVSRLAARCVYQIGNHEAWIQRLFDHVPGISDTFSLHTNLGLNAPQWEVLSQGSVFHLGKLYFIHGDQIRSSAYPARWAVEAYGRSIRFGHFHRAQVHTKISALDVSDVHTGIAVPGLCRRDPAYARSSPNQWMLGFLWGYVFDDGSFTDYLTCIVNGRFAANNRVYGDRHETSR